MKAVQEELWMFQETNSLVRMRRGKIVDIEDKLTNADTVAC